MSKKEISDERNWEAHFQEFVEYKRVHGDYNVPRGGKLGNWVHHQRRTKGKMSEERRKRLDSIGFVWKDIRDAHNSDLWEARFQELVEYKRVHRDCYVPRHYTANKQLGGWVSKQRTKEETMSEERRKRLNSIETPIFVPWEVRFQQLLDYERVHGNCNVPYNYKANLKLGTWVSTQRSTKETMRENRRNQLNSIGFVWSLKHEPTRSDLWEVRFQELVEYKRVHRDCNVPRHYKANKQLGTWVNTQRENKEKMREERRKRLDSIGFVWKLRATPISVPWEVRFQQLLDYKRVHGNCNVPYNYKANLKLRTWVNTQRTKEETMRDERRKRLNSIGFTWKILEARIAVDWEIRFKQLVEYKRVHGNCNVPNEYNANLQLGNWVKKQRQKKETLSEERRKRLNSIGFTWKVREAHIQEDTVYGQQGWDSYFEQLRDFVRKYKHCNVPAQYPELGRWAEEQRLLYERKQIGKETRSDLTDEREAKLMAVGFGFGFGFETTLQEDEGEGGGVHRNAYFSAQYCIPDEAFS